jgi:tRNA(fMet)-specific endonuclease VapC
MPTSHDYLIDTNIAVALLERDDHVVRHFQGAGGIYLSMIAIGELLYGAANSARPEENKARVLDLAGDKAVLYGDLGNAELYGEMKARQRRKGRPIPGNDLWIAALERQHALTLVSRDAHFQEIDELELEVW